MDAMLMAPSDARDAIDRDVCSVLRQTRGTPWPERFIAAELNALRQGDVPYWSTSTSSLDVREGHHRTPYRIADRTGMESMRRRLAQVSHDDLHNQTWMIDTFLRIPEALANTA
jgi:hypothetical protein